MSDNIKNVVSLYTVPDDQIQYIHAENNVLIFTDTPGKNKLYRGTGKESPLELVGAGEAKYLAETHFIYGNEFNGTQDVSNNLIMTGILDNSTGKGIFNELNVSAKFITNGLFLDDRTISFKDSSGNNVTLTLDTSTFANLDVEANVVTKTFDSVEDVFDQSINDISDDDIGTMYYVKSGTSEIDVPETFILNKNREIIPTSSYIVRKNEPDSSFNYHKGNVIWIDKLYSSGDSNDLDINKGEIGPDDTLITAQDYKNLLEAVNKLYYILGIDMDAGNVKDTEDNEAEGLDAGEFNSETETTSSNYGVILTDLAINQKTAFSDYDTEEKPDWLAALDEESEDSENKDEENKDDYDTIVLPDMLPEDITEIGEHFVKAIRIKRGKYSDMMAKFDYLLDGELVWCIPERNNNIQAGKLYIKTKDALGKPVMMPISSNNSSNTDNDNYLTELVDIEKIDWISNNLKKYRMIIDDNGRIILSYKSDNSNLVNDSTRKNPKLYINSLYIGGLDSNKNMFRPCSHNFIELSNLTGHDINLEKAGISLQYIDDRGKDGNKLTWKILPLTGTIKSGETYLIRGAECAPANSNTTRLIIDSYDQIWYDNGEPISFNNTNPVFALCAGGVTASGEYNQIIESYTGTTDLFENKSVFDLIGFNNAIYNEAKPVSLSSLYKSTTNDEEYSINDFLFIKYFNMDPVKQATKAFDKKNNLYDIYAINLRENYQENIEEFYTGKASYQNKTIFYNKSTLQDLPNMITCSFGKKATDNGIDGATRCFNWISKGYYNEYLKLTYPDGSIKYYESFKNSKQTKLYTGQKKITFNLENNYRNDKNSRFSYKGIYDRYRDITTSGIPFTVHKLIIDGLTAGTYKYRIGKEEMWSDEYEFTVKTDNDVNTNGFNFIHHSDQQGFNRDEYIVWRYVANYIDNNYKDDNNNYLFDFTINTGDMTQNGNRINEWLDYYDCGKVLFKHSEQMNTIGNNDLAPQDNTKLGDGNDDSKINPKNFDLYYCYDLSKEEQDFLTVQLNDTKEILLIPANYSFDVGNCHFVCVNSEITTATCNNIFKTDSVNIATQVENWLRYDLSKIKEYNANKSDVDKKWIISYCHEMPFTILTNDNLLSVVNKDTNEIIQNNQFTDRSNILKSPSGCHWNHIPSMGNNRIYKRYYWLSRIYEEFGVSLVLGGHKHTYSSSLPIKENINADDIMNSGIFYGTEDYSKTYKPIIQLKRGDLKKVYGENLSDASLRESWYNNGVEKCSNDSAATSDLLKKQYAIYFQNNICDINDIEIVDKITYPIYVMTQSTGYKLVSNKELPGRFIPWLTNTNDEGGLIDNLAPTYYPVTPAIKVNSKQLFPIYINWNISNDKITGTPIRLSYQSNETKQLFYTGNTNANGTYKLINEIGFDWYDENNNLRIPDNVDGESNRKQIIITDKK